MATPPTVKARSGAITAGIMTLPSTPDLKNTASAPAPANTAPTTPPIRAWDELEGSPKYQVIRFQAIAPTRPANSMSSPLLLSMALGSTTSLATVAATFSEMKAPTKLRIEAYPTASRGAMALVEIDVATTFAVSWNPFVKSNISAVTTTITTTTISLSTAAA